jgi:hypothetical protein
MALPTYNCHVKVTTVRFGQDLWSLLEREAEHAGVSVSQYVREAALARAAASAGTRGEIPFAALALSAREVATARGPDLEYRLEVETALGALARAVAASQRESSIAVREGSSQQEKRTGRVAAKRGRPKPRA